MINLTIAGDKRIACVNFCEFLIGPFPVDGITNDEEITWVHPHDTISDTPSLYGENNCSHYKVEAAILADQSPLVLSHSAPTAQYPQRITTVGHEFAYMDNLVQNYVSLAGRYSGEPLCVLFDTNNGNPRYRAIGVDEATGRLEVFIIRFTGISGKWYPQWSHYLLHSPTFTSRTLGEMFYYFESNGANSSYSYSGPRTFSSYEELRDFRTKVNLGAISGYEAKASGGVVWTVPFEVQPRATDKQQLIDLINVRLGAVAEVYQYPGQLVPYGELANSAVQGLDAVRMNVISFVKEIPDLANLIPKFKNLRKLKSLKSGTKDVSDAYLTAKYGWMPTISDLESIWNAATKYVAITDRNGFRTGRARSPKLLHEVSQREHYTAEQSIKLAIAADDNLFITLLEGLEYIGVFPSFSNLWDLVPYSFVFDWFIDMGDLLERVDTNLRLLRLDIRYVTMSLKVVRSKDFLMDDELPFVGNVKWVHYHRWTTNHCPVPPLSLQSNPLPFDHWLEGSALLIQRMR